VIAAAGDIACVPGAGSDAADCHQQQTSALVNNGTDMVLGLGDNQYELGALSEYQGSFDLTWGQFKAKIRPVPGNHEYDTAGAAGYFNYFGPQISQSHYSFDLGSWHLIALDSNCTDISCADRDLGSVPSAEVTWLQNDLAAHPNMCTLAYWHHPLFTSAPPGNSAGVKPLWDALYASHADLVLNGHSHDYERFSPQDPSGNATANGLTEIIVGTGGKSLASATLPLKPNSAFHRSSFGALFLTLHPSSYDWSFIRDDGNVQESGSAACHNTGGSPPPSASFTSSPSAPQTGTPVAFDGRASGDPLALGLSYAWNFGDGASGSGQTSSHAYRQAGTYSVKLAVTDGGGRTNATTHTVAIGDRPPTASLALSPTSALTGDQVAFDGSGSSDPDGSVVGYTWDFGDGVSDYGRTNAHVYQQAGTYSVRLTVTDDAGLTDTATRTVTIRDRPSVTSVASTPFPPVQPTPFSAPPRVLAFSMSSVAFRVAGWTTATISRRPGARGTAFRYVLSEAAKVKVSLSALLAGRLDKRRRCRAPTRSLRRSGRCTRRVSVGTLVRRGRPGTNNTPFSGRIGRRALAPGSYVAVITATNRAGRTSRPREVRFSIMPG
jgi:PKD repeat protein